MFVYLPRDLWPLLALGEACDGCTSSTRRCAWGPCVRTRSCSEVGLPSVTSRRCCCFFFLATHRSLRYPSPLPPSVGSRPLPRPVLPLRRGGAQRRLLVTRGQLREELRQLLMGAGHQGHHPPDTLPPPPPSLSPPPLPPCVFSNVHINTRRLLILYFFLYTCMDNVLQRTLMIV